VVFYFLGRHFALLLVLNMKIEKTLKQFFVQLDLLVRIEICLVQNLLYSEMTVAMFLIEVIFLRSTQWLLRNSFLIATPFSWLTTFIGYYYSIILPIIHFRYYLHSFKLNDTSLTVISGHQNIKTAKIIDPCLMLTSSPLPQIHSWYISLVLYLDVQISSPRFTLVKLLSYWDSHNSHFISDVWYNQSFMSALKPVLFLIRLKGIKQF